MNTTFKIAAASASAAVLVAIVSFTILGGGSVGDQSANNATEVSSPFASADPRSGSSADAGPAQLLPAAGDLDRGRYFIPNPYMDADPVRDCDFSCASYSKLSFDIPEGWATSDGLVHKHLGQPGEVALSAWTVDGVYADACHWQGSALSQLDMDLYHNHGDEPLGERPDEGGLLNQAGRVASDPVDLTLAGRWVLRIELTTPADLDLATCDLGQVRSWSEWDIEGGANARHAPGQVNIVYQVDVDRRPLVIDASYMPSASPEDIAELEAILASMRWN